MKKHLKPEFLPAAMGVLGLAALGLHQLLYLVAVDSKNLMVPGHPVSILLWILCLGALAVTAALIRPLSGTPEYYVNFKAGFPGAVGNLVLAACILGTVMYLPCAMAGVMAQVWRWLGLAAAVALIWIAMLRYLGKIPFFALHLAVCLFLCFHLVTHYRTWSGCALMLDYVFSLLGGVCLVMFAYYHMAFTVGFGRRRMLLGSGLMAMFLGIAGFLDTPYQSLSLGCLFWVYTELCAWHVPPAPEKPREAETEEAEEA